MARDLLEVIIDEKAKTKQFEGFSPIIYKDTKGKKTIGYGFNIDDPYMASLIPKDVLSGKRPLTKEEADRIFDKRYEIAQKDASKFIGEDKVNKLPAPVRATITDMSYNLGSSKLSEFKKFKSAIREGDTQKAAEELKNSKWYEQVGERSKEHYNTIKSQPKLDISFLNPFKVESASAEETPRDLLEITGKDLLSTPKDLLSPPKDLLAKETKPLFEFVSPEQHPILETVQEAGVAGGKFLSTLGLGIPEYALGKMGYKLPEAPSKAGKILAGGAELGGFIKSAIPLGAKIATKIPFVARAFRPATTLTQAITKPIIRGATTLGTAQALMTPEEGLIAPEERAKQFASGAGVGAIFGGISFIPNKALRMITSSAYLGVPSTLKEDPLEQQVINYGLGAYFGRRGGTPQQILAREKPLAEIIRYGVSKPEGFLKDAEKLIQQEKDIALQIGREPISRQAKFEEVARGRLRVYEPITKNWKRDTIRTIRGRIVELKKNPSFQLETGDVDFTVNYIIKDLGFKTSELTKLDNATLYNVAETLKAYQPTTETPFLKTPPLKPQFASNDWRKKINPWDATLRPGLSKMEKLGFGGITEEGLTGKFFTSGAEKAQFMQRYISLRNDWMSITGSNKQRSNDIFSYLDGEIHQDYIKKIHGEKTLQVANQMKSFLDTLLVHINRHRSMYGENPVEPRKNYITHIFEDFQAEIIAKKHPFPDWLSDAMPYIIPQKKTSPFLLPRKGNVRGYQKDIWRALDAYTYRTSEVIGDEPIRRAYRVSRFLDKQMAYERKTGEVSQIDWAGIKSNLDDYTKDLQGRPGKLDKTLRGLVDPINSVLSILPNSPQIASLNDISDGMISLIYGSQMAYRPKLPLRNLGQHSLIIGQAGFKPLGWAIKNRNTQEAREILTHSKLLSSRQRAFGAETQALFGKQAIQKVSEIGLKPYRWADIVNVEDAYLAGYKQAIDNPQKWSNPYKRGDEVAALTQYIYLPENRSDLARGFRVSKTLGRPLSVFTTWPANWIEFQIASATNTDTQINLLKYWATSLSFAGLTALLGIKGAEYTGITSPLSLLQIAKGKLPIVGIAEKPQFRALKEWSDFIEGDKDLMDIFFYMFKEE